jgi:hypothetical protein
LLFCTHTPKLTIYLLFPPLRHPVPSYARQASVVDPQAANGPTGAVQAALASTVIFPFAVSCVLAVLLILPLAKDVEKTAVRFVRKKLLYTEQRRARRSAAERQSVHCSAPSQRPSQCISLQEAGASERTPLMQRKNMPAKRVSGCSAAITRKRQRVQAVVLALTACHLGTSCRSHPSQPRRQTTGITLDMTGLIMEDAEDNAGESVVDDEDHTPVPRRQPVTLAVATL